MYGFVYMRTVAHYPRAIFLVTVLSLIISSICLGFVRLPRENDYRRENHADLEEPPHESQGISPNDIDDDATIVIPVGETKKKKAAAFSYGST